MKSIKMVLVTVIGIIVCSIAASTQHTNTKEAKHVNSMPQPEAPAECSDELCCNFCIPVSQPY